MTAYARRDFRVIEFLEESTVRRGVVLGHLIHPQRRIVALHELRITMTVPADLREVLPLRYANVPFGGIHGFHADLLGIPPMTGDATEASRCMDVLAEGLDGMHQSFITSGEMTDDATVILLCRRSDRPGHACEQAETYEHHAPPQTHFRPSPSPCKKAMRSAISGALNCGQAVCCPSLPCSTTAR